MLADTQKIIQLFKKYDVEWFININHSLSKDLEYSPLHDEISLDSSENISTSVTILKNHKKSSFGIDGYGLDKIESALQDMLKIIDFAQYDEDINLPQITDSVEKDFSNHELDDITFDDLSSLFQTFKNYPFESNITIEGFSAGVNSATHIYINSLGAVKIQKDNGVFYFMELFWENGEKRETHYKYTSTKNKPKIQIEDIKNLQEELLAKISDGEVKLASGNYDIALDREVVIDFLDIIIGNMWAESIREGMSLFSKNTLWEKIFDEKFTIVNNPDLKNYTGTMLFDKEWVTAKKTVLFNKWRFASKFYDYKNALKEWIENLGNSTVSNIELIWESDKNYLQWCKILFTNLMAFHTVDTSTGKFSLNGQWYLLENGQKKDYIKNISLCWDIISLFSNIKAIGDDFKADGNFRVPSMSFKNQKVI